MKDHILSVAAGAAVFLLLVVVEAALRTAWCRRDRKPRK